MSSVSPTHQDLSNDTTLTLTPKAEKCHPYTGTGLRRPRATTIVAGMYARRRVLSLVPAYEVCVCKWVGAPCTHSTFHRDSAWAVTYGGAHGGK